MSMAQSQNPMTGQMTGSMGNFTTSSLRGMNIIRAKAFNKRNPRTAAQLTQRNGFKKLGDIYPVLAGIAQEGLARQRVAKGSLYAAFMAANLSASIDKSNPEGGIDFSKLTVAHGSLPVPIPLSATFTAEGIRIAFKAVVRNPGNFADDELVGLAITRLGELLVERQPRGTVEQASMLIPFDDVLKEDILGVYMFAKSANGNNVSKSVFVNME